MDDTWTSWWTRVGRAELSLILWAAWDPIGGVPRDEYESYAEHIGSMLRSGATEEQIGKSLRDWRTGRIEVAPNDRMDGLAAAKIIDWYTNPFDDIHPRPSDLTG